MGGHADTWAGLRRLVAKRDGFSCVYCGVPTAATIEHVAPRSANGGSDHENLRLACPHCNSTKRDQPVDEFLKSGAWRIPTPPDLPGTVREMLLSKFGWEGQSGGLVSTGSSNAKLKLAAGQVVLLVRAGKRDEWHQIQIGREDHPHVVAASYDFLAHHYTPQKPRRKKPPKHVFVARR